ncbi:P-loop containing nucleoside triphosphate hydrolase protein [Glonium stellatum]|uniref:P-loop containing nucleoside triphosphate hydrolase protein n=1 Tax=Glonium stellatum TaxID=574774 RepID=A0A8E2F510_9PEZI|nr:P-loop containing nucleoside triphosphate hydrolase protein [Glonium stellatum]
MDLPRDKKPSFEPNAALLIGISGPSSSGKTTLSRLLRDIIPQTFIVHLDDFYLSDAQIPLNEGVQDWDCLESLNIPEFHTALSYIKSHGTPPPDLISKEDQNAVGKHGVDPAFIENCRERVKKLMTDNSCNIPIAIIDGFLLFSSSMAEIRALFDIKLFLRTSYTTAKARREARSGYVTLEGFWQDPPGYVDQVVWPNYVKDHAFLFEDKDVHGRLDSKVCREIGILGMPDEAEGNMGKCLEWAVQALEKFIAGRLQPATK